MENDMQSYNVLNDKPSSITRRGDCPLSLTFRLGGVGTCELDSDRTMSVGQFGRARLPSKVAELACDHGHRNDTMRYDYNLSAMAQVTNSEFYTRP